ncbi:MAG: type II toxin-antitoxin system Phd/YefM family antitoxin [Deltaproteobacteria bacterium]|nr:type II toxin-antitoxin system Phd/YefM family antitoxin [Deltaproteobacteria bacterium]
MSVAEAKRRFSAVLREAADGPIVIQIHDRDVAVVVAMDDYARLMAAATAVGGGARFLERVEKLKKRHLSIGNHDSLGVHSAATRTSKTQPS